MHIAGLRLWSACLPAQRDFYGRLLNLPVLDSTGAALVVRAGSTRLTFARAGPGWQGAYHLAFNIPENRFAGATAWLTSRTRLIAGPSGAVTFDFKSWNAHSVYFYDPAGNVLELIARHDLPNASQVPFDWRGLLCVSEIGLATEEVTGTVQALQAAVGVEVYDGQGSEEFTAVGNAHGLFIVVKRGRIWYPDTGVPAAVHPMDVELSTGEHVVALGPELDFIPAPARLT